jgi:hypothetical protein
LKQILHKQVMMTYVDCAHLVQDREHWRALLNTVMNLRIPQNAVFLLNRWATISFRTSYGVSFVFIVYRGYKKERNANIVSHVLSLM